MAFIFGNKKDFLFIHIPKTAGNSISTKLQKYGVESKPLNYLKKETYMPDRHVSARNLRRYDYIDKVFDDYFKFAFFRNPWARLISYYYFAKKRYNESEYFKKYVITGHRYKEGHNFQTDFIKRDFNEWLLETEWWMVDPFTLEVIDENPIQRMSQLDWVSDRDGNILVDFIGNIDYLDKDWVKICDEIGINHIPLKMINKSKRPEYKDIYSNEAKQFVEKHFAKDIEMFGYTF